MELFNWKEKGIMPETGIKLQEGADDIKLGVPYMINDVDEVITEVGAYKGFRVELLDAIGNAGSVMLWSRPVTSPKSKLGSFVALLGSNTDTWLKKWIVFHGWQQNARLVELSAPPETKVPKATTAEGIAKAVDKARAKS